MSGSLRSGAVSRRFAAVSRRRRIPPSSSKPPANSAAPQRTAHNPGAAVQRTSPSLSKPPTNSAAPQRSARVPKPPPPRAAGAALGESPNLALRFPIRAGGGAPLVPAVCVNIISANWRSRRFRIRATCPGPGPALPVPSWWGSPAGCGGWLSPSWGLLVFSLVGSSWSVRPRPCRPAVAVFSLVVELVTATPLPAAVAVFSLVVELVTVAPSPAAASSCPWSWCWLPSGGLPDLLDGHGWPCQVETGPAGTGRRFPALPGAHFQARAALNQALLSTFGAARGLDGHGGGRGAGASWLR